MAPTDVGSQWFEALQKAHDGDVDEVPEGWNTVKEISELSSINEATAYKNLQKMMRDSRVETKKFRIKTGSTVRRVQHYKLSECE